MTSPVKFGHLPCDSGTSYSSPSDSDTSKNANSFEHGRRACVRLNAPASVILQLCRRNSSKAFQGQPARCCTLIALLPTPSDKCFKSHHLPCIRDARAVGWTQMYKDINWGYSSWANANSMTANASSKPEQHANFFKEAHWPYSPVSAM